jgi:hypothetical protein
MYIAYLLASWYVITFSLDTPTLYHVHPGQQSTHPLALSMNLDASSCAPAVDSSFHDFLCVTCAICPRSCRAFPTTTRHRAPTSGITLPRGPMCSKLHTPLRNRLCHAVHSWEPVYSFLQVPDFSNVPTDSSSVTQLGF